MSRSPRTQLHELEAIAQDITLFGGHETRAYCSCGWSSRPVREHGQAHGLWRRHLVLAGRGLTRKQ